MHGSIKQEFQKIAEKQEVTVVDILEQEELAVLNAISTSEGAIQIAMEETKRTLHGSNILILGFGRIGKVLASMLKGIGGNVYCEARKEEDLAWIKAYAYIPVDLKELKEKLNQFDIIFNTIPELVLAKEELNEIEEECIIIDLASYPGGVDKEEAKRREIKVISALSLPGKVAPYTSAEFIKETLEHII